jgi:hypothetical protein
MEKPLRKRELEDLFIKQGSQLPATIQKHKEEDTTSLSSLFSVLEKKLTQKQLKTIKEIGLAIGTVGLSLDDACLRSRLSKEELDNLIIYVPEIKTYLRLKQVEYKYKLLQVISKQATENGDVKIATWLLEKQYSEEYDSSLKKDMLKMQNSSQGDVMEMAIAFVRRASSNTMPVHEHAGKEEDRTETKVYDMSEVIK